MSLNHYQKKRNFKKTSEPKGKISGKKSGHAFVVQKHDASQLHFDFRLEVDGVLKSWAVPKGPSLNPKEKRLAVQTEDHPLDYKDFEGVIPEGEYGAGVVMIWDHGNFKNLANRSLTKCLQQGLIEISLEGHRLKGGFALKFFRMDNKKRLWLLIKMNDDQADRKRKPVSTQTKSIKTGRTLYQIKKQSH